MLYRLILSDGPAEHDAYFGIGRRALNGHLTEAHGFSGDQNSFRIQAMQNILEAAAFVSDAVSRGNT